MRVEGAWMIGFFCVFFFLKLGCGYMDVHCNILCLFLSQIFHNKHFREEHFFKMPNNLLSWHSPGNSNLLSIQQPTYLLWVDNILKIYRSINTFSIHIHYKIYLPFSDLLKLEKYILSSFQMVDLRFLLNFNHSTY